MEAATDEEALERSAESLIKLDWRALGSLASVPSKADQVGAAPTVRIGSAQTGSQLRDSENVQVGASCVIGSSPWAQIRMRQSGNVT